MAYCLTIKRGKEFEMIDLTKLPQFKRTSNLKDTSSYTLDEIDNLTMEYDDEYLFREDLYKYGLIILDDIVKPIDIRLKMRSKLKKVPNGFIFKREAKYLDEDYLRYRLLNYSSDNRFLEKLVSYYRNSYVNSMNTFRIRDALISGTTSNIYNILNDFFSREVYRINEMTGEVKLNYKAFHDLAMFIINYEREVNLEVQQISKDLYENYRKMKLNNLREILSDSDNSNITRSQPKKKIRTKKNDPIEGQVTMEEIIS